MRAWDSSAYEHLVTPTKAIPVKELTITPRKPEVTDRLSDLDYVYGDD